MGKKRGSEQEFSEEMIRETLAMLTAEHGGPDGLARVVAKYVLVPLAQHLVAQTEANDDAA